MLNSEKIVASIQNQDLEHADKYLKRALKEDDAETLLELAEYLESIGFLPQAREIYLQERESYPEVNINLAQIAIEDGDIEGAFFYLDTISPESEAYLSALLVMADIYDMEGLTDVAREKLLLASEISDEPLVVFGLAEIELELGNFNQAIKEYAKLDNREILELTGISTYQRIGRAYASLGKFEAAIEFLEKAIEIEYDDGTIFELATILYGQGEYQKANVYFKQLDTMNPDFEGYEYVYAQSLHEENKTEEALRLVQKGLIKNEFDTNLLLAASQLSYELHDSKQAESYLLKAKNVAVDDEDVLMRLTNLYLEEERYEDVVALSRDNIDNVLTKWNIAKAYQALEADKKALKIYDELATDLADNPEFLQDYAYILREFGQKERAHQVAERYLQLVPDDVNMVEFLNENEF
ncbi:tetratricopeptide repeat protein [Streptococcus macedonicus]|uniref:tetratricopeptide repeat protein n=1 Tax=Streptococcus macedonicus TaxID=59310 RepID=UPI002242E1F7|nr:tetratricopeptide repeat protein [Streptococcus macedonicus]MCW8519932.1 tetratricopeptide repeat protein [Streptococcus macedonicus]MCW8521817.1 tetratricopeptide repeat protein [Streptococcus macedonicus]